MAKKCPLCKGPSRAEGKDLCVKCAVCCRCGTTEAPSYERVVGRGLACLPCKEKFAIVDRLAALGIPKAKAGAELDTLQPSQKTVAEAYLSKKGQSLYLTGQSGVGKTWTAAAIARQLILSGATAKWLNLPWFFAAARDALARDTGRGGSYSMTAKVQEIVQHHYIILDDLGAHRASDWAIEMLYLILDHREAEGAGGLLITSNLSIAEAAKTFGDRIVSRMTAGHGARVMELTGKDLRRGGCNG